MSTKRAGGTAKNLRDSQPKYLGIKLGNGQTVKTGQVIVRQRGTKIEAGKNVGLGKDHTLFALKDGVITFKNIRKKGFDGNITTKKSVEIAA